MWHYYSKNRPFLAKYHLLCQKVRKLVLRATIHRDMHSLLPFASYRYDPFEASTSTIENPPLEPLLDQITLDDEAGLYIYQTVHTTQSGELKRMRGIVGILELTDPASLPQKSKQSDNHTDPLSGQPWPDLALLPHENTTHAYRQDRIPSKRPKHPIWLLDKTEAISQLISISEGDLVSRVTDSTGVHHRIWLIRQPALLREFQETTSSLPLIVADGHHRLRAAASSIAATGPKRFTCMVTPSFDQGPTLATWARSYRPTVPPSNLERMLRTKFDLVPVSGTGRAKISWPTAPLLRIGKAVFAFSGEISKIASDSEVTDAELFEAEIPFPFESAGYRSDVSFLDQSTPSEYDGETFELLPRPVTIETVVSRSTSKQLLPAKTTRFHPKALPGLLLGEEIDR